MRPCLFARFFCLMSAFFSPALFAASYPSFLHTQNTQIVDTDLRPIALQGVAFGNEVWTDNPLPIQHHNASDYARIEKMGMNVVRFYLNYHTFEDDAAPGKYKAAGWDWLDQNVAWARQHHVYLILNMHVPPGGFQSLGKGTALWDSPALQKRLTDIWVAIAKRYADEPVIAGFDLLNEPVTSQSRTQWHTLAQTITDAIRAVDQKHLIFVERVNGMAGKWENDADMNLFTIRDPNVVYEFHFYDPIEYTHQLTSWTNLPEFGPYPNENIVYLAGATWYGATFDTPNTPHGDFDWTYLKSQPTPINDPKIRAIHPALVCARNSGQVWFDDVTIEEYKPDGTLGRTLATLDLGAPSGWSFWSNNGVGTHSEDNHIGRSHNNSLTISNTNDDASFSSYTLRFIPKQGYAYAIHGWAKGRAVPSNARCHFRLDYETGTQAATVLNAPFLAANFAQYVNWGKQHNVPLLLGEFGVYNATYLNERGGLNWMRDVLDLAIQHHIAFTMHAYHEDSFGFYRGYGTPVDPNQANQPLIDLFTEKLHGNAP